MLDSLAMPSPCWEQVCDAISGLALSSTQSEQAFWFALSRPHFCSTASMHLGLKELPPPIVWARSSLPTAPLEMTSHVQLSREQTEPNSSTQALLLYQHGICCCGWFGGGW